MTTHPRSKPAGAILSGLLTLAALGTAVYAYQLDGVPQFVAVLVAVALALGAFCVARRHDDLVHDLFLPVLLFAALGGMTWAVRGSSGFGAVKGCVFAGVMWGTAWWFIARNPGADQTRRYASGWIILALTIGIGLSGARGWMQWSTFFEGRLQTNTGAGEFVDISPTYGFIWLFIAGVPWAGLGACLLAWCAAERPLAAWKWAVRLFCGFGMAFFLSHLFDRYPEWFLPLYGSMEERYKDLEANPNLRRLINDNTAAIRHLGLFLGFLLFELGRRDWRNVTLISTVGLLNGLGWALCQNWKWAPQVWGDADFNWWRCWESCGGISIGIAYGVAYYLVNRPKVPRDTARPLVEPTRRRPYFGALSIVFMIALLAWFLSGAAGDLVGAEWRGQLSGIAFTAALIFGIVWYVYALWTGRGDSGSAEGAAGPNVRPTFAAWLPGFMMMLLIACFMMGQVEFGERVAGAWWARFDLLYLAITVGYGILFPLVYGFDSLAGRRHRERPRVPLFARYPNLDWLVTFLSLLTIFASYFRDELPPWSGWFWMESEPVFWYGLLGAALLALFGVLSFLIRLFHARDILALEQAEPVRQEPNLERFAVYAGLLLGLGMSLKNGTRGWANIYWGDEYYWGEVFWRYIGPSMLIVLGLIVLLVLFRRVPRSTQRDVFPHAGLLVALVVVHQNLIAQAITGPITEWNEMAFNLYYVLLFLITAAVLYHYRARQRWVTAPVPAPAAPVTVPEVPVTAVPAAPAYYEDAVAEARMEMEPEGEPVLESDPEVSPSLELAEAPELLAVDQEPEEEAVWETEEEEEEEVVPQSVDEAVVLEEVVQEPAEEIELEIEPDAVAREVELEAKTAYGFTPELEPDTAYESAPESTPEVLDGDSDRREEDR